MFVQKSCINFPYLLYNQNIDVGNKLKLFWDKLLAGCAWKIHEKRRMNYKCRKASYALHYSIYLKETKTAPFIIILYLSWEIRIDEGKILCRITYYIFMLWRQWIILKIKCIATITLVIIIKHNFIIFIAALLKKSLVLPRIFDIQWIFSQKLLFAKITGINQLNIYSIR